MDTITITFEDGKKREYIKGVKFIDIIKDVKNLYKYDIICGKFRNQIVNYDDSIVKSGKLYLYDINTKEGNKIYERGLTVLFESCVRDLFGKQTFIKISYSIDKGVFCNIDKKMTEEDVDKIKKLMKEKVSKSIPFVKIETSRTEAIEYFKSLKRYDKVKSLFYDTSNFISLYKFDGTYNYILGNLPYDSSILKLFDLSLLDDGIVLRFPSIYDNGRIVKYTHHEKYYNSLNEYSRWADLLNISNIGELNEAIINNNAGEIIKLSEMIQDYKLLSIAEKITLNKNEIKIVLISGPSSSGKTTTSKKLALYLKTLGLNPHQISLDDYFLNREDTPLDEDGKLDFESLRAIDVKLFDSQMEKLLKGNKVITPTYNFVTGKKIFNKPLQILDKDVLIIEGLHALNGNLLKNINKKNKFKIYISPLAFMGIDNDNRMSMTDIRLLRRMVRDNRTRGYSPEHTLSTWESVRKGEEKYVFPFQDDADVIFNSILAYEIGVLKTYVEPLLFSVNEDNDEYMSALRLIELLKFVLPIPSDTVPDTSILREFIGNSYFEK